MMEEAVPTFLYQSSILLEIILLLVILVSIRKPPALTAVATGIMLIRPNERMDLAISFIKIILPALLIMIAINLNKFKKSMECSENKYLLYFIALLLSETLLFNAAHLVDNIMYIATGFFLYLSIITFIDSENHAKLLCITIAFSSFIICCEPIYYHFFEPRGSEVWKVFNIGKSGRLQAWGMWGNPNETAFIATLGFANVLLLLTKYRKKKYYLAALLLLPFFTLVNFLTASRAGFACLLIVFSPLLLNIRHGFVKISTIVLMLCIVIAAQYFTPSRTDMEGSSEDRAELRTRAFRLAKDMPLTGVGFNRARYELGGKPPHNTYVQAFAETGFLGGILLIVYLLQLGKKLYHISVSNRETINNFLLSIVFGIYCSSIFYFYWGNQLLAILFFLAMAQVTAYLILVKQNQLNDVYINASLEKP